MKHHDNGDDARENGRSWVTWLVLIGIGAVLVKEFANELPALRRYLQMERM